MPDLGHSVMQLELLPGILVGYHGDAKRRGANPVTRVTAAPGAILNIKWNVLEHKDSGHISMSISLYISKN